MPEEPTSARRIFPGGRPRRLPRLDDPLPTARPVAIVGTAFVRATVEGEDAPAEGFTGYFTYESLFNHAEEPEHVEALAEPYLVLDVTPDTPWDDVAHRHRQLVKDFHPDRFVDATPEERAEAEDRIRVINVAFSELRRLHPGAN